MKNEPRFDVIYRGNDVSLDYHFCREWDGDQGCYGTNQLHGLSFEDAKKQIIQFHEEQIAHWKDVTLEKWKS